MFFFVDGRERLAYASFMATNNNTGSKQMAKAITMTEKSLMTKNDVEDICRRRGIVQTMVTFTHGQRTHVGWTTERNTLISKIGARYYEVTIG